MDIVVVDNFFDNFEEIENEFKKIELYDIEKYKEVEDTGGLNIKWPGYRSKALQSVKPELYDIFNHTFNTKLSYHQVLQLKPLTSSLHVHLRPKEIIDDGEEDFIHIDSPSNYSCLVYLNETNYQSGTAFFEEVQPGVFQPSAGVSYIKNRLVIFDSTIPHRSIGHFGENIYNGRLTLNSFFYNAL